MSWDLYLLPAEHVAEVDEWLEAVAEEGHRADEALRHAEAVRARRPELELGGPFGEDYQLTLPEDSGLPLDVGLYGNHASISVAFWDLGPRAATLGEIIVDVVEALEDATGWVAYDPQDGRVVRTSELGDAFVGGQSHGAQLLDEVMQPRDPVKRKRRFRLF